jgi:hypothetical protein
LSEGRAQKKTDSARISLFSRFWHASYQSVGIAKNNSQLESLQTEFQAIRKEVSADIAPVKLAHQPSVRSMYRDARDSQSLASFLVSSEG